MCKAGEGALAPSTLFGPGAGGTAELSGAAAERSWDRLGSWCCSSDAGPTAERRVINRSQRLFGVGKEVTAIKCGEKDLGWSLE